MKRILLMLAISILAMGTVTAQNLANVRRNLMPVPAKVEWQAGRFVIGRDLSYAFSGKTDQRLRSYWFRAMRRLEGRTLFEFPRDASVPEKASVVIETISTGNAIPQLGDDESYRLTVTPAKISLTAPTTVGAMRGIETLLQLVEGTSEGFSFPAVTIDDTPRFPWRGLMIDSARHFQPIDVMRRNLDAMAAMKLNVLHWHLTEDQGFRVESKKFPELHLQGSDGDFYTQDEIRGIIRYAAERGIRVMPEFDMPGHATSWLVSHPEIGSAPGPYKIERLPGVFDPTLDPTNEATYKLLRVFFAEMAALFPDRYMHIGGDENEGKHWSANPKIQAFMKARNIPDNHALQTYFNTRLLKFLQQNGKIMMGWDEIFQPDLPKDIVIHSWRGQKALADAARQGYTGVLSNGYYIDLLQPASQHYVVDPIPADSTLNAEERKRVLGGEATMWSEWVSPETIDSRIWPRTAAIAERLWSPAEVREIDDMYRRLDVVSVRLEELGLTHRRNQSMLLRRLAGSEAAPALEKFVGYIEPVKGYLRYQLRKQTMLSPLTGLIDAAQADAPTARQFNNLTDRFLTNGEADDRTRLAAMVGAAEANQKELVLIAQYSPALFEARGLVADFGGILLIAREALAVGSGSQSAEWREERLAKLKDLAKPKESACEVAIAESVRKLVIAAAVK